MTRPERFPPSDSSDEAQRRRDKADVEKQLRQRGLIDGVEVKKYKIEDYLKLRRQKKDVEGSTSEAERVE